MERYYLLYTIIHEYSNKVECSKQLIKDKIHSIQFNNYYIIIHKVHSPLSSTYLVGLIEQPSIGIKNKWATITDIAIGYTPKAPPPSFGMSTVENTLNTSNIVPNISAKKT